MEHYRTSFMNEIIVGQKRRKLNSRLDKKLILLGVEGKNSTEASYFLNFNRLQNTYRVKIAKGRDTHLFSLIDELNLCRKDTDFKKGDLMYCIFDLDNDPYKIKVADELIKKYRKQDIIFLYSNPCFELFFLWHFIYSTKPYSNSRKVITDLKKHMPYYEKNINCFHSLFSKIEIEIRNSENIMFYHSRHKQFGIYLNPVTKVHVLVKLLFSFIQH